MPVCEKHGDKHICTSNTGEKFCFDCGDHVLPKVSHTLAGPNERQVGGAHYSKFGSLQHWDVVNHFQLDYFLGQITKYVMRWKDKNGVEDLKKAQHFLEKYIELSSKK